MKKSFKTAILFCSVSIVAAFSSCSDKNDEPDNKEPDENYQNVIIGFENVPDYLIGGPTSYGENLYYGAQDQITTGYLAHLYGDDYVQFPVNYGLTYDNEYNEVWGFSFFNGGFAVSDWHDMTQNTYYNQLSVYNVSSPSGGNYIVGFSSGIVSDIKNSKYSDFSGCPHIYITDAKGYTVANEGSSSTLQGEEEDAFFESVYINNTTYVFDVIKNGNDYANALNEENEGWFKVQFIAFDDNDSNAAPVGYTEAYLANFKKGQAGDYIGIIDTWTQVDLSNLPECSVLVINFEGSDMGDYGLNTPTYVALDKFEISVEK